MPSLPTAQLAPSLTHDAANDAVRAAASPTTMAAIPPADRPRERLLRAGGASLSDAELLAVLLRTGRRGLSALHLARELLDDVGGLGGLLGAAGVTLRRGGLGEAKAASVLAAIEIGRRLARARLAARPLLNAPEAVARYLCLRHSGCGQEVMGALFLDVRHGLLGETVLFRGTRNEAVVEPQPILKEALLRGAGGLILFHTHPSGDPGPSAHDIAFTRRMADAGNLIGVRLIDHVIVGSVGRWVSLRRQGAW
ncbi:MAG: DNA repair protein RadC [Acidobacteriota bacterium]